MRALNISEIIQAIEMPELKEQLKLLILDSIDSTNNYLKSYQEDVDAITVCLAEHQTAGRGRQGKVWHSPAGVNIYCSMRQCFSFGAEKLKGLSLVIGLSIIEALETIGFTSDLKIKWPNDVYWRNKKLAGCLIDIANTSQTSSTVIIGVGLNVNMKFDANAPIDRDWTSLLEIGNSEYDRNKICAVLIERFHINLQRFESDGFSYFSGAWQRYDYLINKRITLKQADKLFEGIVQGVNADGELLLEMAGGEERAFQSGEIILEGARHQKDGARHRS